MTLLTLPSVYFTEARRRVIATAKIYFLLSVRLYGGAHAVSESRL